MAQLNTNIQTFYYGKTIFITGATGFLGKCLVEKLLRSCLGINQIILPVRATKNEPFEKRKLNYFNDEVFDVLKTNNSNILNKVILLQSNLEDTNLGLNNDDYQFVINSVNIIFHLAASVEFFVSLKNAVNSNIKVTQNVISLAKDMEHLQALVYVSTAWSHYPLDFTEEKVHNLSYKPEFLYNLVNNLDEGTLQKITPALLNQYPNVYLLTKNVSENLIEAEKNNLPVAIFRPGGVEELIRIKSNSICHIVTASYREAIPGWVSMQIAAFLGMRLAAGLLKVVFSNMKHNIHFVPVDFVINCMVAIAWNKSTQDENKKCNVYNFVPMNNPISRKLYYDSFINTKYPLEITVGRPGYITETNKWWFDLYVFLYETFPAHVCDALMRLAQQKPIFVKVIKMNKMIEETCRTFVVRDFKFEYENVPALWKSLHPDDQKLFNFDLDSIDWNDYMDVFTKGVKSLLKEDFDKLEKCEAKRYLLRSKF